MNAIRSNSKLRTFRGEIKYAELNSFHILQNKHTIQIFDKLISCNLIFPH